MQNVVINITEAPTPAVTVNVNDTPQQVDITIAQGGGGADPATQAQVDAGIIANKYVAPLTFENAAKWATKFDNPTGTGSDYLDGTGAPQPFPSIPPPSPVDSVNGYTGIVVLGASDVGADVAGSAATAESNANTYTDNAIAALPPIPAQLTAGTDISIVGNAINNTAPDQVVSITAGTNIGVTGTYPNFTIDNTATSLPPSGAAGGDLAGSYPNPSVHRVHGKDFQSGNPSNLDVWIFESSPDKWQHRQIDKSDVGLGNVDNTSDANKPISTATQTALNAKEDTITAGTTAQYYRGDKTFQTLDKTAVGLGNVDNTSDANKPISTATQTALNAKENTITTLTIAKGGTNSSTALNNNRVMRSSAGAIVEAAAITASRALKSDANGIPTHFDTATEPSLTELTYVKGVTSAIQTQINAKENTITAGGTLQYFRGDKTFQNYLIVATDGALYTNTGNTNLNRVLSILIPANTYTANSIVYYKILSTKTLTNAAYTVRTYIHTSAGVGGTQMSISSTPTGTQLVMGLERTFQVQVANGTGNGTRGLTGTQNALTEMSNAAWTVQTSAINWTVDQYLNIFLQNGSALDTSAINAVVLYRF